MPINAGSHMLDLRLAERALRGEGRSKQGGRISGQMKREEYRKQKKTKLLDKERRIFRDRMNFQERKFLSIQMFKKDLNPFLMVLKNKLEKPLEKIEGDDVDETGDCLDTHISAYKKKYLTVKYLDGHDSIDLENIEGARKGPGLPDIKGIVKHMGKNQPLEQNNSSKGTEENLTNCSEVDESSMSRSRSPESLETLKYPKCLTFPNIYKASQPTTRNQENQIKDAVHLETYKTVTFMNNSSGTRSRTSLSLQKVKPGSRSYQGQLRLPALQAARSSAPIPKTSKKSYSDVLIDTCRALAPQEARMAERKRVEAENAEGITELKARILRKCRQGAEQDVFKDDRWKLLINILPTPRD